MTADAMPDEGELTAAGLRLDADGSVLTIWLARPGVRNAQTPAMWRALADRCGGPTRCARRGPAW